MIFREREFSRRSDTNGEVNGTILEVLPNAMYLVRLEDGRQIRAGAASSLRHAVVRLIAGDQVVVRLTSHDPSRGYITVKRPRP